MNYFRRENEHAPSATDNGVTPHRRHTRHKRASAANDQRHDAPSKRRKYSRNDRGRGDGGRDGRDTRRRRNGPEYARGGVTYKPYKHYTKHFYTKHFTRNECDARGGYEHATRNNEYAHLGAEELLDLILAEDRRLHPAHYARLDAAAADAAANDAQQALATSEIPISAEDLSNLGAILQNLKNIEEHEQ